MRKWEGNRTFSILRAAEFERHRLCEDFEAVILSVAKNLLFSGGSGTQADASLRSA
jgi:hypothetical protein